jgi:RHS repeat-associated protein
MFASHARSLRRRWSASTSTGVWTFILLVLAVGSSPRTGEAQVCQSSDHKLSIGSILPGVPCTASVNVGVSQSGLNETWQWADNLNILTTFTVTSCSGIVTSCSVSPSSSTNTAGTVTVTYSTSATGGAGTIEVRMKDSTDFVVATLHVTTPYTLSTAFTNGTDQSLARCAQSCFAAMATVGTPPYISMDTPRAIGLVYNGDRVRARPFIYADVASGGSPLPINYQMQVTTSAGAKLKFTNGDTVLTFAGGASGRLGGQLALDSTIATGPMAVTVTTIANDSSGPQTQSAPLTIVVDNERNSPVAHGWTLAGVQHMYVQTSTSSILVTEGSGSAEVFTACTTGGCTAPVGEYSTITYSGSFPATTYVRKYPDSSTVTFNNLGQMIMSADAFGNSDSLAYDSQGRLIALYDPFRKIGGSARSYIQLIYGSTYGLSTITSPGATGLLTGGRTSTFRVNPSDSTLAAVYDPDGDSTVFGYDGHKRLSWERNRSGDTTKFGYDTLSFKLTSITTPPVPVDSGNGMTKTQLQALTTTYSPWQIVGVPTSPTSPSSPAPLGSQSPSGSVTDPASHVTSFTVNRWGEALVVTNAESAQSTVSIADSNPVWQQVVTSRGGTFTYTWSGGKLTSSTPPGGSTSTIMYNSGYSVADSIVVPGQPAQRRFIGTDGRIDSVRFASTPGRKIVYTYDSHGRVLQMTDIHGHVTTYSYDTNFGNLDSVQGPGTRVTVKRFDRFGRDSVVAPLGVAQSVTLYDSLNRVISVNDGVNPNPTVWTYDSSLYSFRLVDPKGQLHKQLLDALGRPSRVYDLGDTTKYTSYRYSVDGLLTGETNRRGQQFTMAYNSVHQLTSSKRTVSGTTVAADSFAYDIYGLRAVRWNSATRDSVFGDLNGWTDSVVTHFANVHQRFKVRYGHDNLMRLDTTIVGDSIGLGLLPRYLSYDSASGAVSKIALSSSSSGLVTKFGINTEFNQVKVSLPGTDSTGKPGALQDTLTSSHLPFQRQFTSSVLDNPMNQKFGFDSLGRFRTDITVNTALNEWNINRYWYDQLGRLQSRHWKDSTGLCGADTTYGYQCTNVNQADTLSYDAANNLTGGQIFGDSVKGGYRTGNRDTTLFGVTHTFDNDGDVLTNGSRQFFWGVEGHLDSVVAGTVVLHYEYDALGRLVKRSRNGSLERLFLWDGSQLLAELNGTGTQLIGQYVSSGMDSPFALITPVLLLKMVSYYVRDPVGTTVGLVRSDSTSTQSVREQYSYTVLGAPSTVIDSALGNRMQWKGMVYEGDSTRLYYVRARWYDPQQGRFMSEDPLGDAGGLNQYAFAGGDPINGSDPTGQCVNDQCYLTLFGTGIYGWDLANGCIDCDAGVDPTIALAYGYNVPEDMMNFNPYSYSSSPLGTGCGNFAGSAGDPDSDCGQVLAAIAALASVDNGDCNDLAHAADAALQSGALTYAPSLPPPSGWTRSPAALTYPSANSLAGGFVELGPGSFQTAGYRDSGLTYTIGAEMGHYALGLPDNNPDTNTMDNPGHAPAISCLFGADPTFAVPHP